MKNRCLLVFLLGVILLFKGGCAYSSASQPDPSPSLNPNFHLDSSRAFQRALKAEPASRSLEQARIDYLLERVSNSPYNFIRNGSRYTGIRAETHLRWKHFRTQRQVRTAEEFIDRVATYSKMSGQPYLVLFPDKKRYELQPLLLRELKLLDQAIESERERMKRE